MPRPRLPPSQPKVRIPIRRHGLALRDGHGHIVAEYSFTKGLTARQRRAILDQIIAKKNSGGLSVYRALVARRTLNKHHLSLRDWGRITSDIEYLRAKWMHRPQWQAAKKSQSYPPVKRQSRKKHAVVIQQDGVWYRAYVTAKRLKGGKYKLPEGYLSRGYAERLGDVDWDTLPWLGTKTYTKWGITLPAPTRENTYALRVGRRRIQDNRRGMKRLQRLIRLWDQTAEWLASHPHVELTTQQLRYWNPKLKDVVAREYPFYILDYDKALKDFQQHVMGKTRG